MALFRRLESLWLRWLLAALALLNSAGCPLVVPVPYPVSADVVTAEAAPDVDAMVVTVGPRRLLQDMSHRIRVLDDGIGLIDPVQFRDAAFPAGGWSVGELLAGDRCPMLRDRFQVHYLILLLMDDGTVEKPGANVPFGLGATGYETERSALAALIVDLETARVSCQVQSSAEARDYYFVTWAGGYVADAVTDASVKQALAEALVGRLREQAGARKINVALLSAEASIDNLP